MLYFAPSYMVSEVGSLGEKIIPDQGKKFPEANSMKSPGKPIGVLTEEEVL